LWAHWRASRPSFAPADAPPSGVEDSAQTTLATHRQLWLCAMGLGAVDDVGEDGCRPDKMRRRRSLPGNRHLPRATDSHHAHWNCWRQRNRERERRRCRIDRVGQREDKGGHASYAARGIGGPNLGHKWVDPPESVHLRRPVEASARTKTDTPE
jgi:hypothetical protein